jgi:hypothetical protein
MLLLAFRAGGKINHQQVGRRLRRPSFRLKEVKLGVRSQVRSRDALAGKI